MSAWLLTIVGVTVIGVLVELLLTDSPMSKFIRTIYAFFILFVIVQPIPGYFKNLQSDLQNGSVPVNSGLVKEIDQQTKEALVQRTRENLASAGFANCIVTYVGGKVYINAYNSAKKDTNEIIKIVTATMGVKPDAVEVFT